MIELTREAIFTIIRELLLENYDNIDPDITIDTELWKLGLDSLDMIEFAIIIDGTYKLPVDDEGLKVLMQESKTFGELADNIIKLKGGAA